MIISAKVIFEQRKPRRCANCEKKVYENKPIVRTFGRAHHGEQPFVIYQCLECSYGFARHKVNQKLMNALANYEEKLSEKHDKFSDALEKYLNYNLRLAYDVMIDKNPAPKLFATLIKPLTMKHYKGHWDDNGPVQDEIQIEPGTTVQVVVASRLGDLGISENLENGATYGVRVPYTGYLINYRKNP